MGENIQTGLLLLVVGLPTVFLILLLVIALGRVLIWAVNKYAPAEAVTKISPVITQATSIASSKVSAIISAVNVVTNGKGKVTKIEKI